jgi:hypothetical protein
LGTPSLRNLARFDTLRIHECIETAPPAMAAVQASRTVSGVLQGGGQTRIAEAVSRALAACAALLCWASFPATADKTTPDVSRRIVRDENCEQ